MSVPRLAVIGLGNMGGGMARRLLGAGFPIAVHNRTRAKAEPLRSAGATVLETPTEAARAADVVLLSLSDEAAVDQILFGQLLEHLRPDTIVIDTSTVSPAYAREADARLRSRGIRRVEACVVGNPPMALAGQLRVFTAGEEGDAHEVRDVLAAIAQEIRHLGPAGQASMLKLAFNLLLGAQTAALAEAVAFCEQRGLDRDLVLAAIMNSGWRSPVLQFRADFMRNRRYDPAGFRASLMAKDLDLITTEAALGDLRLPLTETAGRLFHEAAERGLGEQDAAVVAEIVAPASPVRSTGDVVVAPVN
ncbi:NAD(P)-dependent oxidoreductase [Asanoa iriomotensis]|uniref:3-hydroxyisobutyrate dehydrogenase n=1 Tax=Asanoa iriomotensis TaxID=234613 RepID=A0ABQ4C0X2_9ACTN|nr:NAD(P)-dependent oxidoreductase [Asanoa iriomotensis]GIF56428.1 3-hydroxyisobutyrate dehydrogenase [Asanoa iriomotensis]